jgi:hypothetical protein
MPSWTLHNKIYQNTIFESHINCHSDFCCTFWGRASNSVFKPIITLEKKALRMRAGSTYHSHTDPLFASFNCLKFEDHYRLNSLNVAGKIIEKKAPPGLDSAFRVVEPQPNLRNKSLPALHIPYCITDAMQRMASYNIPKKYSETPDFMISQCFFLIKEKFFLKKKNEYKTFSCQKENFFSCNIAANKNAMGSRNLPRKVNSALKRGPQGQAKM